MSTKPQTEEVHDRSRWFWEFVEVGFVWIWTLISFIIAIADVETSDPVSLVIALFVMFVFLFGPVVGSKYHDSKYCRNHEIALMKRTGVGLLQMPCTWLLMFCAFYFAATEVFKLIASSINSCGQILPCFVLSLFV